MQKLKPYDRQEFKAFADNLAAQNAAALRRAKAPKAPHCTLRFASLQLAKTLKAGF